MVEILTNPGLALYVAAGVALVVMAGFLIYLWSLDRRVRELQRAIEREATAGAAPSRSFGAEAPTALPGRPEAPTALPGRPEPLRPQPIDKGAK